MRMENGYPLSFAVSVSGWFASALVIGCVLLLIATPYALPQTASTQAQQVANELPPCSVLREQIEYKMYGDGIAMPYMEAMRKLGVKRAFFEIDSMWHGGKPTDLQVVNRLYFDQFDGPNSQILDSTKLAQIKQSGLEADLDKIARERVMHAPLFVGLDSKVNPSGKRTYSYAEMFANPWVPEQRVVVSPLFKRLPSLLYAAMIGDVSSVEHQLKNNSSQRELYGALYQAVGSRYDNSAVIKAVINAGADVNARGADGVTPLMNAVAHPCNLRALLDAGADVSARDKWGKDALQYAREVKQPISVRLLEKSAANSNRPEGGANN